MNQYDKAFKEEVVRLSDEIGLKKAAEQLGVAHHTLQDWRKRRTVHGDGAHIGSGRAYASAEIELEREIGELRRANESSLKPHPNGSGSNAFRSKSKELSENMKITRITVSSVFGWSCKKWRSRPATARSTAS